MGSEQKVVVITGASQGIGAGEIPIGSEQLGMPGEAEGKRKYGGEQQFTTHWLSLI